MSSEDRLEKLESRLAQLDDEVQSLNLALYRQGREVDALKQANEKMLELLKALREQVPAAVQGRPEDEIPPHY